MLDSKKYSYFFKDTTTKQLRDKIEYISSISTTVDTQFKDDYIYIRNKNIGRKNNSAFVGQILKSGDNCYLEGSFPDEKSNKILILFLSIWYIMFVFFTFGKFDISTEIISYGIGLLIIVVLIIVFFTTQKKALAVVKNFINDLN